MEALDFPVAANDEKTGCERNSLRWTREMDHCLRRVVMQHVILGDKGVVDNKFSPLVYDGAISDLRECLALELTKEQVEDCFNSWKREYGLIRDLLDQGDFEWDDHRKMLLAKDSVWDASIEVYYISVNLSVVHVHKLMMHLIFLFLFPFSLMVFKMVLAYNWNRETRILDILEGRSLRTTMNCVLLLGVTIHLKVLSMLLLILWIYL